MKLAYNIENGEIGAFGEALEIENYVVIDENIKKYILTNCVKLKKESCVTGKIVTIEDFEELKTIVEKGIEDFMLDIEYRVSKIELGV
ncbi:hypothetical protein SDC9_104689 [bioreactor metagenome]|uniref:Uncharacterized protein n=1 Tax=bioreactor metagenome TaxID=1076179 RepID=A0A645AX94_9ZZZZ